MTGHPFPPPMPAPPAPSSLPPPAPATPAGSAGHEPRRLTRRARVGIAALAIAAAGGVIGYQIAAPASPANGPTPNPSEQILTELSIPPIPTDVEPGPDNTFITVTVTDPASLVTSP